MRTVAIIGAALTALSTVAGHSTFQEFWDTSGADKAGTCVRTVASNSPVTSATSADIACNVNGNKAAASTCTVAAGGTATVEMHAQPGDRSCSNEAIGGNHDGPVIVYMAKVSDASTAVGSSVGWFKVAQSGLISTGYWGTDDLNKNCGKYSFKVPSDIAAGDYLIRAEVIALHVAGSVGGAQFYMSCYQVTVTGGGSASPPTVKFPGAYSATDPGILYDVYANPPKAYTVPGPAVYTGGAGPGSTTKGTTTSTTKVTTTSPTSTSAPPSGTGTPVAHYGQCGGQGWTGSTLCATPYVCTVVNSFYYQCL